MYEVRYARDRGIGGGGWLDSRHTFSFANYFDPNFMGFSHLRVINEDYVQPGTGFGTHPHRDMEILSYVLEGTIEHQDSMGNKRQLKAGEFQIMSAGTGITHSEMNPSSTEKLHFYQIWVIPNELGIKPRYEQKAFVPKEGATLLLSPNAEYGSFKVHQNMKLYRHQYSENTDINIELNKSRRYWVQVVKGVLKLNDIELKASDAMALVDESELKVFAYSDVEFLLFDLE
ncbi:pirin family protein [Campylobacter blaseri]|uniref:Quercetin 2,3-dioxygenase n=1 Tax=Campylobacter blaseri TaxID=2042961 RepID=A0A2P8QYL6_9BACT|nr:pirin family protein [Campylobacter blaseri]PSM51322.1 quercetin 2,3-dioxygenase [Campylobacter blaseri]PSM52466.1 quercetin 2,3-dioxygenase [Campylobacter blaseri]QKF86202.1 pirin family protein [Campylobacter blaseri]